MNVSLIIMVGRFFYSLFSVVKNYLPINAGFLFPRKAATPSL